MWVSMPPLEQPSARYRQSDVARDARLQPTEQLLGTGGRLLPAGETARHQQPGGGRGLVLFYMRGGRLAPAGKAGRIAKGSPAVSASSAAKPVTAERKPVGGIHRRVAAFEPGQEARVQMDKADDVQAVVLQDGVQHRARAGTAASETCVGAEGPAAAES